MGSEYRPDRRIGPTEPLTRVGVASEEADALRRKHFQQAVEVVLPKKKFQLAVEKPEKKKR
jgi:hypothetical protein